MPAKSAKEPFLTPELRATAFYFSIYMAGTALMMPICSELSPLSANQMPP